MNAPDRVHHEEIQIWPPWVIVLVLGGSGVGLATVLVAGARGETSTAGVRVAMAVMVAVPVLLAGLMGRLAVRVRERGVTVAFGPVEVFKRTIPFDGIESVEAVVYSPLREFGGWGYRLGLGRKTAWTVKGKEALVVHETDGRRTYLGSADPRRLRARIDAAAAGRFGAPVA